MHFCVLHCDLFTAGFALALLDDHYAPLAHLSPAAQRHAHGARFRGAAARARSSWCTNLTTRRDEHGAALTEAEMIVNGHRLTAVLRYTLGTVNTNENVIG